jgi:hypothetical protein
MGRWQNKINNQASPPLQNLQNTDDISLVGSVGMAIDGLENKNDKLTQVLCDKHSDFVDVDGLPLHHCRDKPYSDSEWISRRLKRVALHKRALLAGEYASRYLSTYKNESNEIIKQNKARKNANLWLLRETAHVRTS